MGTKVSEEHTASVFRTEMNQGPRVAGCLEVGERNIWGKSVADQSHEWSQPGKREQYALPWDRRKKVYVTSFRRQRRNVTPLPC
jgi:hypothetical protein